MLSDPMKPHGTYKIRYQRRESADDAPSPTPRAPRILARGASAIADDFLVRLEHSERRARRILDSLRQEIAQGGGNLRIRQIFETPREIYRVEIELPDLGYQRTTLLDRDALETLLEAEEVRDAVATAELGG